MLIFNYSTISIKKGEILVSAKGTAPKIEEDKIDIIQGNYKKYEANTLNCLAFYANMFAEEHKAKITVDTGHKDQVDYLISF